MTSSYDHFPNGDKHSSGELLRRNFTALADQLGDILECPPVLTREIQERLGHGAYVMAKQGIDMTAQLPEMKNPTIYQDPANSSERSSLPLHELVRRNLAVLREDYAEEYADEDPFVMAPGIVDDLAETALYLAEQGVDLSTAPDIEPDDDEDDVFFG